MYENEISILEGIGWHILSRRATPYVLTTHGLYLFIFIIGDRPFVQDTKKQLRETFHIAPPGKTNSSPLYCHYVYVDLYVYVMFMLYSCICYIDVYVMLMLMIYVDVIDLC